MRPTKAFECPSCGARLPLTDGSFAVCPACGARVSVPEAHQALREATWESETVRADFERRYAETLRPLGWPARVASDERVWSLAAVFAISSIWFPRAFLVVVPTAWRVSLLQVISDVATMEVVLAWTLAMIPVSLLWAVRSRARQ